MPLDQPTASGPPSAYFPEVGDSIVVGIVNVGQYQQRDYDTNEPKVWPDGGKVIGKVVTGLVVSTTGGTCAGGEKANSPVDPGDLVTFWCEGGKWFTYRDALKAHGSVDIGDVMQWARTDDEPPKNSRHNARKTYVAKLRGPEPKDGDLAARCRAAHEEIKRQTVDSAPAEEQPEYSEAPF